MIDARRMEVYTAIFDLQHGSTIVETQALILEPVSFQDIHQKIIAFGNGAMKWKETCMHDQIEFSDLHPFPEAKNMGLLAYDRFQKNVFAPIITIEPNYLKEFMGTKPKQKNS
jgi:tRNA threonylcarbamoyladenosine biosynthesis protein TsaB